MTAFSGDPRRRVTTIDNEKNEDAPPSQGNRNHESKVGRVLSRRMEWGKQHRLMFHKKINNKASVGMQMGDTLATPVNEILAGLITITGL
jgi:hypothetical protein